MSTSKRREEKKRRREKRVAKRSSRDANSLLKFFDRIAEVRSPDSYPGAADLALERPDLVKHDYANWVDSGIHAERMRRFERNVQKGLLHFIPNIVDWAMEEFLWHGSPDEPWQPMDEFLIARSDDYPPAAALQLKRWKDARIGLFEVGECADDFVSFRECDAVTLQPVAPWVRAIALNIGGVNDYASMKGMFTVTYLSPWAPEQGIFCAMGYGFCMPRADCSMVVPLILGMRAIKSVSFPLPWRAGVRAAQEFAQEWSRRDWHAWMKERVRCPFQAAVALPKKGIQILTFDMMTTRSAEEAQRMGIYFAGRMANKEVGVIGATNITPIDFDSPNALAFAEYLAFRDIAGPPPATRGW